MEDLMVALVTLQTSRKNAGSVIECSGQKGQGRPIVEFERRRLVCFVCFPTTLFSRRPFKILPCFNRQCCGPSLFNTERGQPLHLNRC